MGLGKLPCHNKVAGTKMGLPDKFAAMVLDFLAA